MTDALQIIQQGNEKFIPIRSICDQLGIAYQPQVDRIKKDPIMGSVATLRVSTGADGKQYEMVCIPFKYAFMWLSKINPQNVEESAREGLVAAQSEAYDLLWNTLVSYQKYVEYRGKVIEQQRVITKYRRAEFNTARTALKAAEDHLDEYLAITFEDYLAEPAQLEIDFDKED